MSEIIEYNSTWFSKLDAFLFNYVLFCFVICDLYTTDTCIGYICYCILYLYALKLYIFQIFAEIQYQNNEHLETM